MLKIITHSVIVLCLLISIQVDVSCQNLSPEDKTISIYFGGGSYYIDEEQEGDLIRFIEEVDDIKMYQIEVHGHTDNIGSYEFNHYLSNRRCAAVIYILTNLLIEPETIFQYDHGESDPDYSNDTWNGKLHNRRVDIILRKHST
jgi:outer membrane protein OmpA-like peptidoglycan-associated protein